VIYAFHFTGQAGFTGAFVGFQFMVSGRNRENIQLILFILSDKNIFNKNPYLDF
jgi:hypothetical protein